MHCSTAYHDQINVLAVFRAATANCKPFVCQWAKLDKAKVSGHGSDSKWISLGLLWGLFLSLSLSSKHFVRHAGRATRYAKAKSLLVIHSLRTNLRRCGLKPNMSPLLITKFICLIMYFNMWDGRSHIRRSWKQYECQSFHTVASGIPTEKLRLGCL